MAPKNRDEALEGLQVTVGQMATDIEWIKKQLNPATQKWNDAVNDVKWLKRFFWMIAGIVLALVGKMLFFPNVIVQ